MDGYTFASKLIDAFTNLVDALAWPIVILLAIIILRPQFENLIGLIETVKYKGAEIAFRDDGRTDSSPARLATDTLENFWRPGGQTNTANATQLRQWMRSNGIDLSITAFLHAGHLDATRQKAVKELGLDQPDSGDGNDGG